MPTAPDPWNDDFLDLAVRRSPFSWRSVKVME